MCSKNVQYTSIEAFRAAVCPHLAWWMDLPPDELVEWPELEDEILARYDERMRAAATKE